MSKKVIATLALLAATAVVASRPLRAQSAGGVRVVQWPIFYGVGSGIRVDTTGDAGTASPQGTIWATTRQTDPKLIRLVPGTPIESAAATWTAWSLASGEENAEGIAITADDQIFVRTTVSLQRIDPETNVRTSWADGFSKSDLALGADGSVWAAMPLGPIERLEPDGRGNSGATITRWFVGGSGEISLAGLAVRKSTGRVYFSDNGGDAIGELDPATNEVRRWSTASVGAIRPRQLALDSSGDVWAVMRSNQIVRLRPATSELTAFALPTANAESYGIVADGLVGFTESALARVGLLIPTGSPIFSAPTVTTIVPSSFNLSGHMDLMVPETGTASPIVTDVPAIAGGGDASGYFIEAQIPGSFGPLGIDRNPLDPPGTFYYTDYGSRVIGRTSLPVPEEALVTGGGWIDVDGGRGSFSFTAFRKEPGGPVKGNFRYRNHTTGETFESAALTDLLVYGSDAIFSGTLTTSAPFTVQVSDRGEPGTTDTFRLTVNGTTIGGTLAGGNVQIHRRE